MRTLTSPRSSSNSVMSSSFRNCTSSLISLRFILNCSPVQGSAAQETRGSPSAQWKTKSNRYEVLGAGRQHFAPRLGDHDRIFDADAVLSWQIDARLDCNHHAG